MAGLFEPEGDQIWNKDLRWQPIPIQVVPKEDDPVSLIFSLLNIFAGDRSTVIIVITSSVAPLIVIHHI